MANALYIMTRRAASERGQALSEYGLIIAFIAIVCAVALGAFGIAVSGWFSNFTNLLP